MTYRTNYILYRDNADNVEYKNKACFGGFRTDFDSKINKKVQFFILKKYGDRNNDLVFTDDQIKQLVKDLKSIGFKFRFYEGKIKDYYKKHSRLLEDGDSEDAYIFDFVTKNYKNISALLFVLSILRYLYEISYQNVLREYFIMRDNPKTKRFGIAKCLQLAHYKGTTSMSFGGHCVAFNHHKFKMVTNQQLKDNISFTTHSAQSIFKGKQRAHDLYTLPRNMMGWSVKKIHNLLK